MRIKSYFVKSVAEAMVQARTELGDDALLLSTRKLDPAAGAAYEIVFGTAGEGEEVASARLDPREPLELAQLPAAAPSASAVRAPAPEATQALPADLDSFESPAPRLLKNSGRPAEPGAAGAAEPDAASVSRTVLFGLTAVELQSRHELADELDRLQAQMDEIQALIVASAEKAARRRPLPMLAGVQARLSDAGFHADLAAEIVERIQGAMSGAAPQRRGFLSVARKDQRSTRHKVYELLRTELGARVKIDPALGRKGAAGVVVAMVGPAGVGKTSLLTKVAAAQVAPDRPVHLFALDNSSLASRMQLQLFARKAGITFTPLENPLVLPDLVAEAREKEIVLIDTPALSSAMERQRLAGLLAGCEGIDIHLVVPAYMSAGAIHDVIRAHRVFRPAKLAITKLDESTTFGTPLSEAVSAGLSLSLLSSGASGAQNLHAASIDGLISILFGDQEQAASA